MLDHGFRQPTQYAGNEPVSGVTGPSESGGARDAGQGKGASNRTVILYAIRAPHAPAVKVVQAIGTEAQLIGRAVT